MLNTCRLQAKRLVCLVITSFFLATPGWSQPQKLDIKTSPHMTSVQAQKLLKAHRKPEDFSQVKRVCGRFYHQSADFDEDKFCDLMANAEPIDDPSTTMGLPVGMNVQFVYQGSTYEVMLTLPGVGRFKTVNGEAVDGIWFSFFKDLPPREHKP